MRRALAAADAVIDTAVVLRGVPIASIVTGSQNYGLADGRSDVDVTAVWMPDPSKLDVERGLPKLALTPYGEVKLRTLRDWLRALTKQNLTDLAPLSRRLWHVRDDDMAPIFEELSRAVPAMDASRLAKSLDGVSQSYMRLAGRRSPVAAKMAVMAAYTSTVCGRLCSGWLEHGSFESMLDSSDMEICGMKMTEAKRLTIEDRRVESVIAEAERLSSVKHEAASDPQAMRDGMLAIERAYEAISRASIESMSRRWWHDA